MPLQKNTFVSLYLKASTIRVLQFLSFICMNGPPLPYTVGNKTYFSTKIPNTKVMQVENSVLCAFYSKSPESF